MRFFRLCVLLPGLLLAGIAPLHAGSVGLIFDFNEFGVATYSTNGGTTFTALPAGTLVPDNTGSGIAGNVLEYNFSAALGGLFLNNGDAPIAGLGGAGLVGDLRFTDAAGVLTGTDANLMIFYSFDGLGAPADVGPISTVFLTSQTPVTSELSNGAFTFTSGGVVTYNGSEIPEPFSASLLLVGLVTLGFIAIRRDAMVNRKIASR